MCNSYLTIGIAFIGPDSGEMAEAGESGRGRLADVMNIVERVGELLDHRSKTVARFESYYDGRPNARTD